MDVVVERLHALLDELATDDVTAISQRDELLEIDRARARLDAEFARRLHAFDKSHEWSVDGRGVPREAHPLREGRSESPGARRPRSRRT